MSSIDYDLCKLRAVVFDVDGVLSPSLVPMSPEGVPQRMANLKDGYALKLAKQQGLEIAIITGADTEAVVKRFKILGIDDCYIRAKDKAKILHEWMESNQLTPAQVAYVGDDIPDMECMLSVGLPVAPADACADIKDIARFITKSNGGYGVARELLEELLKAKNLWPMRNDAYGW